MTELQHPSKYMRLEEIKVATRTNRWRVVARRSGDTLGIIKWYGGWRQYVFFPARDVLFNADCLHDVKAWLHEANVHHQIHRQETRR